MNKNLSEIVNRQENLKVENQFFIPSIPRSCIPLWNNVLNDQLLLHHKYNLHSLMNEHNLNQRKPVGLPSHLTASQFSPGKET